MSKKKTIAVSGGFDPIHVGHIRMILAAAKTGDVIVILNSDDWLERKKGYKFMSFEERAFILGNIKGVSVVTNVLDEDGTVCEALRRIKPNYFANGGDQKNKSIPEIEVCKKLGIKLLEGLGEKIQSSSWLLNK